MRLLLKAIRMRTFSLGKAIFFLSLLISPNLSSQNINELYLQINHASHLAETGSLDSAIITYEKAFEKFEYTHVRYLRKVLKLAKKNNDKKRIANYKHQIKRQLKGANPSLFPIIDSLIDIDQNVRARKYKKAIKHYNTCLEDNNCNKENKKFIRSKNLWKERIIVDSSNFQYLLKLFGEYGFIGEEQIGSRFQIVDVLLLHFCSLNNSYLMIPFLDSALSNGKISPLRYAQIVDLYLHSNNSNQKYLMWPHFEVNTSALSDQDIEVILNERESIGIYNSKLLQEKKGDYWVIKNKFTR